MYFDKRWHWLAGAALLLATTGSAAKADHCIAPYSALAKQLIKNVGDALKAKAAGKSDEACAKIRAAQGIEERMGNFPSSCVHDPNKTPPEKSSDTADLVKSLCASPDAKPKPAPQQAEKFPAAPAPHPSNPNGTASAGASCGSDITGLAGSSPADRTKTCLKKAQWTWAEPYNHGSAPVTFHPFNGKPVIIQKGQSLWSIPDESAPGGRRLEARPWDKETTFPDVKNLKECRQEGTKAKLKEFIVGVECEIYRQGVVQEGFESREDNYPYMHSWECRAPWKVVMTDGWQKKPLEYWKIHQDEPVGWCTRTDLANREQNRPIREPKWRTAKECADEVNTSPVTVNKRGVRGCTFKND